MATNKTKKTRIKPPKKGSRFKKLMRPAEGKTRDTRSREDVGRPAKGLSRVTSAEHQTIYAKRKNGKNKTCVRLRKSPIVGAATIGKHAKQNKTVMVRAIGRRRTRSVGRRRPEGPNTMY